MVVLNRYVKLLYLTWSFRSFCDSVLMTSSNFIFPTYIENILKAEIFICDSWVEILEWFSVDDKSWERLNLYGTGIGHMSEWKSDPFNQHLVLSHIGLTAVTELTKPYFAFHKELIPSYLPTSSHHHLAVQSQQPAAYVFSTLCINSSFQTLLQSQWGHVTDPRKLKACLCWGELKTVLMSKLGKIKMYLFFKDTSSKWKCVSNICIYSAHVVLT